MKDPEKATVHDVFDGSVRYAAPVYQRYYVWGNEPLQVLLEDIDSAENGNAEQFIGATVLQDFGKKGGSKSPNEYLMIDGQQRLTTIYLLICGLVWAYLRAGKKESASTLAQTYLSFSAGSYAGMPKLLPTIQDRNQLFGILKNEITCVNWNLSGESTDEISSRNGISSQWKNIKAYFSEEFFTEKGRLISRNIESFEEKLLHKIVFIQVALEINDDANTVFSKLNYDGVKLSLSDLVRNDVISRLQENNKKALDKFYDTVWKPFENPFPRNSFDQYITVYSFIKFKGAISKSRAFPELQKNWAKKRPTTIVSEMKAYADLYCSLCEYTPIPGIDLKVNERIRRISLMPKTTVTWPYILELLAAFRANKVSKKQTIDCLSVVESFLVRRAIVGLEPTGLHAVFKGLWHKVNGDPNKLKEKIVTGTIRCPDDKKVIGTLCNDDMYARRITKYLLIQREVRFNSENGYDNSLNDFSIEHVMPQNLTDSWASEFSKEEHKALVHTIGNLVPLTKDQNLKVKCNDWKDKKKKYKGSNWKTTQKISSSTSWNKAKILSRSKDFAKWAVTEWPSIE